MSGHTKGTWKCNEFGQVYASIPGKQDQKIAYVEHYRTPRGEANAELIASAPTLKQQRDDLLAACEEMVKVSRNVSSMAGRNWLQGQLLLIDETDKFEAAIEKCET